MARDVGDLWPFASGTSSLGVDQINGQGGFSREIRPFNHVHMNSGVWHDPTGGSGIVRFDRKNNAFVVSVDGGIAFPLFLGANPDPAAAAGSASVRGDSDLSIVTENLLVMRGLGACIVGSDGNVTIKSEDFSVTMRAAAKNGDGHLSDLICSAIGQTRFTPFDGSGVLTYEFGPFEAWHTSPSHTADKFPIAHSGQVVQMIAELGGGGGGHTMQAAYDGGPLVVANGPIIVAAGPNTQGLKLGPLADDDGIPLNISGIIKRHAATISELGDMRMHAHSFGSDGRPVRGVTTKAQAEAESFGPAVMSYDCGSGLMPVAIASGVTSFVVNAAATIATNSTGTDVPLVSASVQMPDAFYVLAGGDSIRIQVPGFYRCHYTASLTKLGGNLKQTVRASLRLNGNDIAGGRSYTVVRSTVDNQSTATGMGIFNAEPGDLVTLNITKLTNLQHSLEIAAKESVLILEYLSPPRGGVSTI